MEIKNVNMVYLSVLFILIGLTAFGQNRGVFTSIQGDLSRLSENTNRIGIKDSDTIIFDVPYFHLELFKMDSSTVDTFDTVEPSMLRSIYELREKMTTVFLVGTVQPTDGYRFFKTVLDSEAKKEMLPVLKELAHSSYRPVEDSLYFFVLDGLIHPSYLQRKELVEIATPYLSDLQLEVFDYLMTTEKLFPLDFWLNKGNLSSSSSMFEISTTKYTAKIPGVSNYVVLLEEKGTKCWKFQMKKLRKEFGVRRKEALSENVVSREGLTIRFY